MKNNLNIYLISGPLGVGKSSLSKMISQELGYELIIGDDFLGLLDNSDMLWEDKLKWSWEKIISKTKDCLSRNKNVVIDFVVEDELKWFLRELKDFNIKVKYVVLIADEKTITKRLKKRDGSTQYLERSKVLLKQLGEDENNSQYIVDTTGKETREVFEMVVKNKRFEL